MLLAEARIGEGALVEDSVLGAGAVVGRGAELRSGPVERIRVLDHESRVGVPRMGACLGDRARVPAGEVVRQGTLAPSGDAGDSGVRAPGSTPGSAARETGPRSPPRGRRGQRTPFRCGGGRAERRR